MYEGVGKASCTGSSVCLYTGEGITMDEIDQAVHQMINDNGAYPSPLGYVMGGLQGRSKAFFSTNPSGLEDDDNHGKVEIEGSPEIDDYDFLPERPELQLQGVDPKKGWNFLGVHKAIICGKVGQSLVQKILRKGKTVTTFTVATGGMFDQRFVGANYSPKLAQWHQIAVHNPVLGAYAVQQLVKKVTLKQGSTMTTSLVK